MSNNQNIPTAPNLALRFSQEDKAALVELSQRLKINQTEVLRVLVRKTLDILDGADAIEGNPTMIKMRMSKKQEEALRLLTGSDTQLFDAIKEQLETNSEVEAAAHNLAIAGAIDARSQTMINRTIGIKAWAAEAGKPMMIRSIGANIRAAEAGDPTMKRWVKRNAHWVMAYRNYIKDGGT